MTSALWIAAVVIASLWHPFRPSSRSAASSAGLRLCISLALLFALFVVPRLFDRGNLEGTDTCPGFIDDHSDAWWASVTILSAICWSGIGVLKASATSVRRRERQLLAVVAASLGAAAVAGFGGVVFVAAQICF